MFFGNYLDCLLECKLILPGETLLTRLPVSASRVTFHNILLTAYMRYINTAFPSLQKRNLFESDLELHQHMHNDAQLCNIMQFGCEFFRMHTQFSSLYPPRGLGGELLPLHVKRSQLRWCRHLIRMPPGSHHLEGFLGTSNWEKTREQSQNSLKRLYISFGLRERLGSLRRSWKLLQGRGAFGIPCLAHWYHRTGLV